MTTLLLAIFEFDSETDLDSLEDYLELLSLVTNDAAFDDVWVTVFCGCLTRATRKSICQLLQLSEDHVLQIDKLRDRSSGALLLAHAIAYLHDHQRVVVHDVNEDKTQSTHVLRQHTELTSTGSDLYSSLHQLDEFHRKNTLTQLLACLDQLLLGMSHSRSGPGQELVQLIQPLCRFVRTLNGLLLMPPTCDTPPREGYYDSMSLLDFSLDVNRLHQLSRELDPALAAIDFVSESTDFFRAGSNALGALSSVTPQYQMELLINLFCWWHTYHLAVSKELTNLGFYSAALLHTIRAFETYVFAHLTRAGKLVTRYSNRRFALLDGNLPTFEAAKVEFRNSLPLSDAEPLLSYLEDLGRYRNENKLIHGFHLPGNEVVRRARHCVKGLVSKAERLHSGAHLLRGIVSQFWQGENREGNLGRIIATALLSAHNPARVSDF